MTAFQGSFDLRLPEVAGTDQQAADSIPEGAARLVAAREPRGVVYTRAWVVELILNLVGYRADRHLASYMAIEPSAGEGAFLLPMVRRLVASVRAHGGSLSEARNSIRAYELDAVTAARAIGLVDRWLRNAGVSAREARDLAAGWVQTGDYLLDAQQDRRAHFVVGNPPYIRYNDVPDDALEAYRALYPTMVGRGDIYIGFIEAGLRQLTSGGVLGFICADRWMRSAYGAELRRMISSAFSVEAVVEMHDAPAFENEVAAYPAVIVVHRSSQGGVLVASAGSGVDTVPGEVGMADAVTKLAQKEGNAVSGFTAVTVDRWFRGNAPWPSLEPRKLALLQRLEAEFGPLEDTVTGTRVGIGVATGADRVFITTDQGQVESNRVIPLAMTADTRRGFLQWSGHYLINPWQSGHGLVDLAAYPLLRAFLEVRKSELERRHISKRRPRDWYRTIDPVHHEIIRQHKLYFPDMKLVSNPVLDRGETYPHHNLYYLTSEYWDLEVLGGLLLSRVAQLFIEAYCVKMRGGTLRFQAQYLRRIRVPSPDDIPDALCERLRQAFRSRDTEAATGAAIEAYGIPQLAAVLL